MTSPQQRIHELTIRQVYYGSSMTIKLNAVNGKWNYTIWGWRDFDGKSVKFIVKMGRYNNQDPEELFKVALDELGVKKIKLGVPQ